MPSMVLMSHMVWCSDFSLPSETPLACVTSIILLVDLVSFSVFLACSTACNSIKLFFWSCCFPEFTNWDLWKSLNLKDFLIKVDDNNIIKVKGKLFTVRRQCLSWKFYIFTFSVRRKYYNLLRHQYRNLEMKGAFRDCSAKPHFTVGGSEAPKGKITKLFIDRIRAWIWHSWLFTVVSSILC